MTIFRSTGLLSIESVWLLLHDVRQTNIKSDLESHTLLVIFTLMMQLFDCLFCFLISSRWASEPRLRLWRFTSELFRWMYETVKRLQWQRISRQFQLPGLLWRIMQASKKTGSNQHRLSSRGTLQPPLGDCDLAVGCGSLTDIWNLFYPHATEDEKGDRSSYTSDVCQMR